MPPLEGEIQLYLIRIGMPSVPISEISGFSALLHGVRIKDREAKTSCGVEARGVQVVICRCEPEPARS